MASSKATFAAGCFWGVEEAFRQIPGVLSTSVGYTGGHFDNPSYEDVCSGQTGHAEALEIEFDPQTITFNQLLALFWQCHDPTTLNRQGPDVGSQYRSAIFCHSPEQEKEALASKELLNRSGQFTKPVITEISPASKFWKAEEYHQRYLQKRGVNYCH